MTGVASARAPDAIDWEQVESEWRVRRFRTLRQAALSGLRDAPPRTADELLTDVDELLFPAARAPGDPGTVLDAAFAAAAGTTDGQLVLALYVHGRCLEKWERSEDYGRVLTVVDALDGAARRARADGSAGGGHAELLSIVVGQAQVTKDAMGVEDAMSCSCPVASEERARKIVAEISALLERERELGDELPGLQGIVRADAETTHVYFEAIVELARAVCAFVDDDAPGRAGYLDDALAALGGALGGDVYESELRAHRAALAALGESSAKPRLRIVDAELVYLYPFALLYPADPPDDRGAAERTIGAALGGRVVGDALAAAGLPATTARKLELTDLWDRSDVPEPGYSGVSVELPPITVETTSGEDELLHFESEVRLSRLGNHHLRVRSRLVDAGLHELNQALRRGSPAMGAEGLMSGERTWSTFAEYADEIVETIAAALGAEPVVNLNATFHVVLSARSISVQHEDGRTTPAGPDDLRDAVGASLLFHPVRNLTTSLEEWIRYPDPEVTNLLDPQGYAGDLVVRTDNTTIGFMPASPEWLIQGYQEMIEFVTSVPPLVTLWERQATTLARDVREEEQISIEALHEQNMRILELEQEIRGQVAFLRSPALCRTRRQRRFMDDLWEASGLPALEAELERRLTLLAERQARIAALVSSIDERRRRELRHRAEIVLGLLAAASLAGVLQWVDEAFGVDARFWAWVEVTLLVAAAVVVATIIARGRRSA